MIRRTLLGIAVLAAACAGPQERLQREQVDRYLEDLARRGAFQGAVVLGHEGRVTYARGFGFANIEKREPFTPDTPSDGASVTKTLTAAAILQLVQQARVDLDAPVQRYVPGFPHAATRVRHLLAHSAGLPDYDWFDKLVAPPAIRTNDDQLALLRRDGYVPAFVPGSRFAYDNVAYDVAAMVVESASGLSYARYLREKVFEPLGMRSAFLRPARLADFPGVRTVGYRRGGATPELFDAIEGEGFHGGGNLYFSAMDLHRWASSFIGQPVLDAPTLARGLERARLDDGRRTNLTLLSWYASADGARHYYIGHHNGFYNLVYWDRARKLTVAFVSNNGLAATLATELPRALVAFAEGRAAQPIEIPPMVEPAVEAISGTWRVEGFGTISIRAEQRRRYMSIPGGVEFRMFRFGPGLYAVPGLEGWMRFHGDPNRPALLWDSIFLVSRGVRE